MYLKQEKSNGLLGLFINNFFQFWNWIIVKSALEKKTRLQTCLKVKNIGKGTQKRTYFGQYVSNFQNSFFL